MDATESPPEIATVHQKPQNEANILSNRTRLNLWQTSTSIITDE